MEITERYQDNKAILRLAGSILGEDRLKLNEAIQTQVEKGYDRLVLNFKDVDAMDSVGLGMLIAVHTSLSRRDAKMVLSNVGRSVNYLLTITSLNQVFEKYDTENDALNSFTD